MSLGPPFSRSSDSAAKQRRRAFCGKVRLSRAGAHWFDRSTGLNILLDEVDVPTARWSRAPRYVSVALTNACELRCPFCYAPKVPGRLDPDLVCAWAQELDDGGALGIGFGGGEPTAHPDFVDICREVALRTRLAVTFTTHGHRLTPELAVPLRGFVHFIRLSMDGVGATYEHQRGRCFADFERRVATAATICPFGLNVVVNDETVDELDAIATFAKASGATELLLLPEQPVGNRPGMSRLASRRLTDWVASAVPGIRLAISQAGVAEGMPLADPFPGEPALDAHAHVDARGVLKEHAYAADGIPVGPSILHSLDQLRERRST